jgi:hypothetical protein
MTKRANNRLASGANFYKALWFGLKESNDAAMAVRRCYMIANSERLYRLSIYHRSCGKAFVGYHNIEILRPEPGHSRRTVAAAEQRLRSGHDGPAIESGR